MTIAPPGPLTRAPETEPAGAPGTAGARERPAGGGRRRRRSEILSLSGLVATVAALYLTNVGGSGWANPYYSAAVQAGTTSWRAFFFGSFDASNFITLDKPPLAFWVMEISSRLFGLNPWSILVPEALEGVATVVVLYVVVRRWFPPAAALLAAAVAGLTPTATAVFRSNAPDALLVLLLTLAAYATLRAVETASTWWMVAAGACVGLGFLAKMTQALLVFPAIALVFLLCGPGRPARRVVPVVAAGLATVVSADWWVVAVDLTPAARRPYVGGSSDNSVVGLVFQYDGLQRLTGAGRNVVANTLSTGGPPGPGRLFNSLFGDQVSWLLPAALLLGVGLWWCQRRGGRGGRTVAALVFFGAWLVVGGAAFSVARGIIHPYYAVALVPALGALVGIGAVELWQRRADPVARATLALAALASALWAAALLDGTPGWLPPLRFVVLAAGAASGVGLLRADRLLRRARQLTVALAVVAALAGPLAYSVATAAAPAATADPTAGPAVERAAAMLTGGNWAAAGGPGGRVVAALEAGADRYRWVAAMVTGEAAGAYELAAGAPLLAVGGYDGSDPTPTLAQFKALVAAHEIHYFLVPGRPPRTGHPRPPPSAAGGGTLSTAAGSVLAWVESHFSGRAVEGVTLYDLAGAGQGHEH